MVAAVRRGHSLRAVARQFRVSPDTIRHWAQRANGQRLDRVDWYNRSRGPRHPHRTEAAIEEQILAVRRELEQSNKDPRPEAVVLGRPPPRGPVPCGGPLRGRGHGEGPDGASAVTRSRMGADRLAARWNTDFQLLIALRMFLT